MRSMVEGQAAIELARAAPLQTPEGRARQSAPIAG